MPLLKITDASGRQSEHSLAPKLTCNIGRAPDNQIVLDDPRASRHHAHIQPADDGSFVIIDGVYVNGQINRSANKIFINGEQKFEHVLKNGDRVTIGASTIKFEQPKEERTADLSYDDKPLGHPALMSQRWLAPWARRRTESCRHRRATRFSNSYSEKQTSSPSCTR